MKSYSFFCVSLFFSFFNLAFSSQVALTFDDTPRLSSPLFGNEKRAQKIRDVLKEKEVPSALFLATPSKLTPKTKKILFEHGKSGHVIGNHTHSHMSANDIPPDDFINDVKTANHFLKSIKGFQKLFRFPFLREGKSRKTREKIARYLEQSGYRNAYVTVDTSEWFLEQELLKALKNNLKVNYQALRDIYIASLLDGMSFYKDIAKKYIGRDIAHTLLLHENELAGLFLDDLIDAIRKNGWKIISPQLAYSDKLVNYEPNTMLLNQGRVMAYAIDKNYTGPRKAPLEFLEPLKKLLQERKVFYK